MDLNGVELAVALAAVAAGALVQGSIGFGFVLLAAPVVGVMEPQALPVTFLWLALPLSIWMAIKERHHIDRQGFAQMTAGRIVGSIAAAWVVAVIAADDLAVAVGSAIVLAVLISAFAPDVEVGAKGRLLAGVVSGLMGTVGGVGGPASVLAYQQREGAEIRATLAITFVVGTAVSLVALGIAGKVELWHLTLAGVLLPGMVVGLAASRSVIEAMNPGWVRPTVLVCAGLGGIAIILQGL